MDALQHLRHRLLLLTGCSICLVLTIFATSNIRAHTRMTEFANHLASWRTVQWSPAKSRQDNLESSLVAFFDQVYGRLDPEKMQLSDLQTECATGDWHENLYLECHLFAGGLATMISEVKTCLRMAIELGANLIIPTTLTREADLTSWDVDHRKPLGFWFDREFLINRLAAACPKMKVVRLDESQQPELENFSRIELDYDFAPFNWGFGPYSTKQTPWRSWFLETAANASRTPNELIVLHAATPSQFFDNTDTIHHQVAWFELGHLLRARSDIRNMIHSILSSLQDGKGNPQPYIGVHFRVEKDVADDINWTSAEQQIDRIWEFAEEARALLGPGEALPRIIYLACGDHEQIEVFRASAQEHGWVVVDKWSIAQSLDQEMVRSIDDLDFDHEAMIDMAMLLISDFFFGVSTSAFSYTIAHLRSPTGRYLGSSLNATSDAQTNVTEFSRTHLFGDDGGGAYQCCL